MLGSLISGGLGLVGDLYSAHQARSESARNRSFQQQMSDTAHQREVEDLRKAGLNPILSVNRSGASTPSGSMAPPPQMNSAVSNYNQSRLISEQIKNIGMDTEVKKENADLLQMQQMRMKWEVQKLQEEIQAINNSAQSTALSNRLLTNEVNLQDYIGTKGSNFKLLMDILTSGKNLRGK